MEPDISFLYSKESAIGPYPYSDPVHVVIPVRSSLILYSHLCLRILIIY